MGLSDEDRAAIKVVRRFLDEASPGDLGERAAWKRVLRLAGEEPPEPASGTFWLDPEENELWMRDDTAAFDHNDPSRWWCTGTGEKFSWIQVCLIAPKLVELVVADVTTRRAHTILFELASAWEAWHHTACGRSLPLVRCDYHECRHRWQALLGYGLGEDWNS